MKRDGAACWDTICSLAPKEAKDPQGQMIPERERSASFVLDILGHPELPKWTPPQLTNGFPKGNSEKGAIG